MTSKAEAAPRPAPTFRPPRALPPALKAEPGSTSRIEESISRGSDEEEFHPAKRRKIDRPPNASTTSSQSTTVPIPTSSLDTGDHLNDLKKGPWRFSDAFLASTQENTSTEEESLPALPTRPWQHGAPTRKAEEPKSTHRVRKNIPIPNTPDKAESPNEAHKIGKSTLAGFFPWTGKDKEDVLNESNVKYGYFDRPPNPPEKEMGTAKTALQAAFKHRCSLDFLSVLFGLALERKGKHGVLSSTSNFRPPPRVTLTEAKRKAWLADLANPDVPLRRLSRTIPQGIRGQSLLDQCLSNVVPISRALWFIKCVGANEIRTLKRKGPGGALTGGSESKWLKEWTAFVGQFLESVLQQSTQPEWKNSMQYAIRLSSQLYLENLVDRDLYLDWVTKSFANTDHDRAPFFLLLVRLYMPDIIRFRRRSRRLASALIEKLNLARTTHEELLEPLISNLKTIIRIFAMSRPICFVMPEKWSLCKDALQDCLDFQNAAHQNLFDYVEFQNQRTAASPLEQSKSTNTSQQAVIKLLDESKAPFNVKMIMKGCVNLCHDIGNLVSTVLSWATTQYRASPHRLYLAVRLLRLWDRNGYDVEQVLLKFLTIASPLATNQANLHHLISELSRSRIFSVNNYLHKMLVKGSRHNSSHETDEIAPPVDNDPSQILAEISLHHLPDHVRNLRKLVLSRCGFRTEVEASTIAHCRRFLSQRLSIECDPSLQADNKNLTAPSWGSLSWSIKCDVAMWLRKLVKTQCVISGDLMQSLKSTNVFVQNDFCTIRAVLESMGDLAILADVLNLATRVPRESLLASVTDTIDRHADALSAIGAFSDLQENLCTSYLTLRSSKLPLTTFVASLMCLNAQHPTKTVSIRLLQQDMVQGDRGSAVAACSPFSDGVAESLQQAGSHFFDDFEAILQTETNMNEQTMTKLFAVLTERIEKQNRDGEDLHELRALCQLLSRLRLCRTGQSSKLIRAWVERLISQSEWGITTTLLVDLVGIGCLKFGAIMECIDEVTKDTEKQHPTVSALAMSLFTPQGNDFDSICYRFETACMQYLQEHSLEALDLLTRMSQSAHADKVIRRIVKSSIKATALSELSSLDNHSQMLTDYLQQEADSILQGNTSESTELLNTKDIMRIVDDFSYPLCWLSLHLQMRKLEDSSTEDVGDAFFNSASNTTEFESIRQHWSSLLPAAGPEVARYVRRRAEEAFFSSMPGFLQARSIVASFDTSADTLAVAAKYLDIVFAASGALTDQHTTCVIPQLIEKFSLVHRLLTSPNVIVVSPMATTTPIPGLVSTPAAPTPGLSNPDIILAISQYLPLLLRMTCLQRPRADTMPTPLSKPAQQEQMKLAVLLTSLALHPALSTSDLPSSVFAVVSTLITVPTFTDEMQAYCTKLLKDKMRDPRVVFLFGSVSSCGSAMVKDVGDGLQLYKEGVGKVGEWKHWVRNWEVIEPSGGGEGSSWVGLGMFEGRRM